MITISTGDVSITIPGNGQILMDKIDVGSLRKDLQQRVEDTMAEFMTDMMCGKLSYPKPTEEAATEISESTSPLTKDNQVLRVQPGASHDPRTAGN